MRIVALIFLSSTAFLCACISFSKNEQTQFLIDPPSVDLTIQKSLESGYFTLGYWPNEEWWNLFDSPHLNALMQEGLANNPSIQAIQQKLEAAKQLAVVAHSKLYPWVSFDSSYDWEYLSKNGLLRALNPLLPLYAKLYDVKLNLNYEVDIWGKNREIFQAALGRKLANEADTAQVKLLVTSSIAQAFVAVKEYQQQKDLITQLIAVRKAIYELQAFLYEKSLASKLIALNSEENYFDAQKLLWEVDAQLEISKHQLNVLVGRSPSEPLDIGNDPLPSICSLSIPCDLTLDLLARRPDLMAKIWIAEAFAHQVKAAITEYYPDINLTAFLGLESVIGYLLFRSSSFTYGFKPALHLPIFTAGEIQANIDTNIALFNEAIFEYNQLLLNSAQEVVDNLSRAESLFKQIGDQEQLLNKLKERYELTFLLYQKGLGDQLSTDYIKEELIRNKLQDLDLTYTLYEAMIQLIKSLGGGYKSPYVPLRAQEACE